LLEMVSGWILLLLGPSSLMQDLCRALTPCSVQPPPCAGSPTISLGTAFNAGVRHAPCHEHWSTIPNPRSRLALPVLFNPHTPRALQTHVQHQAQRRLDPSRQQRSKPLLRTTPARSWGYHPLSLLLEEH